MKKKKSKNKLNKVRRERETIREYLIRHGNSTGALNKRSRFSDIVVNGKQMSCAERDNLILFMNKKNYDDEWIARALGVPLRSVQQVIYKKGK